MPLISIIVPVYNTEKYLPKCLDSLINQTFKDIEIILINDGSTDNSQKIIKEYQKNHSIIKLINKENGGQATARNLGITKAKGEYLTFIDSDDYIEQNMLEELYNKTKKDKSDIVVCDIIKKYDTHDEIYHNYYKYTENSNINYILSHPGPVARLYKTKLFKENNIYFYEKTRFYEDLATIPLIGLYTKKISYINKPYYYYIIRTGSTMKQSKFNPNLNDIFIVLKHLEQEFNKHSQYKQEIEYLYIEHLLRSASLRYIEFKEGKEKINDIINIFKTKFPQYKKNIYYKQQSFKFKLVCTLVYHKQLELLKIINKLNKK